MSLSFIEKELELITQRFLKEPEESLHDLKKLKRKLTAENDPDNSFRREINFRISQIFNIIGQFKEAEEILLALKEDYASLNDNIPLSKVLNELGINYNNQEKLQEAVQAYLQCLQTLEEIEEVDKMAMPLNNIGQIYWKKGDIEKAKDYYSRSLQLAENLTPQMAADALLNLGVIAAENSEIEKAELYFQRALENYDKGEEESRKPLVYLNLAVMYQDAGNVSRADENHKLAVKGFRNTHNQFGEMHAAINYAAFLLDNDNLESVEDILNNSLKLAEELSAETYKTNVYYHFSNYFQKKRHYKKALEYMNKYHELRVRELQNEQQEKTREILAKYESEQKEKETRLLRQKNKKIEEQKKELDIANNKLRKANQELEHRIENMLSEWHSQELVNRSQENLDGFMSIISGIAHQWKQPLNAIGIIMQNLIDAYEYDEFDLELLKKFSLQIQTQLQYMSDIVNDFAYNFHNEQQSSKFHLSHTLDVITKLISKTAKLENIDIDIKIIDDPHLKGRESEIIQVLMVLFTNAIEALQQIDIKNKIIQVKTFAEKNFVNLNFFNNGSQIPPENVSKIFDVYFSTKNRESNNGLGLALAKKIIVEHFAGDIFCQNLENGVQFVIKLPRE